MQRPKKSAEDHTAFPRDRDESLRGSRGNTRLGRSDISDDESTKPEPRASLGPDTVWGDARSRSRPSAAQDRRRIDEGRPARRGTEGRAGDQQSRGDHQPPYERVEDVDPD
jgi:hypothetical protein